MTELRERTIRVESLTRVEGEGALRVELDGDRVVRAALSIYEPPRFFEAILRGRPINDVPDITARICGICPVAYQMTSVHALERSLGVIITPEIRALRRLLYCGEWIESHAMHIHLLHLPDFFDCASGLELAKRFPAEVTRGLNLKKVGDRLLEVLGGRAVHPINVTVGGFFKAPDRTALRSMLDELNRALEESVAMVRWIARLDFPATVTDPELVSLRHSDEYPMNEGRIVTSRGLDIDVSEYPNHFQERHVAHSTALQCVRVPTETPYLVGPSARLSLNRDRLTPIAGQLAQEIGPEFIRFNPYRAMAARGIEIVLALEEAIRIISEYEGCNPAKIEFDPKNSDGSWATEAPRGMMFHSYAVQADGTVTKAVIVPPTSQNQGHIEQALTNLLPSLLDQPDEKIAIECERLIRCYDPCISCAVHFLKLEMVRR